MQLDPTRRYLAIWLDGVPPVSGLGEEPVPESISWVILWHGLAAGWSRESWHISVEVESTLTLQLESDPSSPPPILLAWGVDSCRDALVRCGFHYAHWGICVYASLVLCSPHATKPTNAGAVAKCAIALDEILF